MVSVSRAARGAVIAMVLMFAVAAPAAATAPIKTVVHPTFDQFGADDSGCGFAVSRQFDPNARKTYFDYADGSEMLVANNTKTITNLENGKTFTAHTAYRDMEWWDEAGDVAGQLSGRFIFAFYPGDTGPDGVVAAPGLGLYFTGIAWFTWDPDSGHITAFSYLGSYVDVCAALSETA